MLEAVSATGSDWRQICGVARSEISGDERLVEVSGVRVNMSFNVKVN